MTEREARLRRRVGGDRMECEEEEEEEEDAGLVRDGDALPSSSRATAAAARLAASATVAAVAAGEPPEWLSSAMAFLAPRLESLAAFCEDAYGVAAPFARAVGAVCSLYVTRDGVAAILGLLACFYGGAFTRLIAVVEALNVTGAWRTVATAVDELRDHVDDAIDAGREDAGRPSMGGLRERGEYGRIASRKLSVYAASIRDPAALSASLAALWSAAATVVAALRVKFARTLVLGVAMAESIAPLCRRRVAPPLAAALSRKHRQWAPAVVDYALKLLAVALAWKLSRFVSAWHSAARGGAACAGAVLKFAKGRGLAPPRLSLASDAAPVEGASGPLLLGLYADEVAGFGLAGLGLRTQLVYSFALPPLLKLLFAPALVAEGLLAVLFLGIGPK